MTTRAAAAKTSISLGGQIIATSSPAPKAAAHVLIPLLRLINNTILLLDWITASLRVL